MHVVHLTVWTSQFVLSLVAVQGAHFAGYDILAPFASIDMQFGTNVMGSIFAGQQNISDLLPAMKDTVPKIYAALALNEIFEPLRWVNKHKFVKNEEVGDTVINWWDRLKRFFCNLIKKLC